MASLYEACFLLDEAKPEDRVYLAVILPSVSLLRQHPKKFKPTYDCAYRVSLLSYLTREEAKALATLGAIGPIAPRIGRGHRTIAPNAAPNRR